jgi:hypothetical protein
MSESNSSSSSSLISSSSPSMSSSTSSVQMGGKKKNGHKVNCKCPICKNMMKHKRGGEGSPTTDKDDMSVPSMKNDEMHENTVQPQDNNSNADNNNTTNNENSDDYNFQEYDETYDNSNEVGGKSRRRHKRKSQRKTKKGGRRKSKRSNGHKAHCGCPICKNMRKNKSSHRGRHSKKH